ncbi:MAG: polysaccharide pyruvyl transferase CsaB [Selenomonadaceae bacterium]|nr:polysaccharide pyruvyl transferase CsaB [Selenomonadaceae bacterium]
MGKIVVSGYYGSKNAGDEAMLAAMLEVLRSLDEKLNITVISANPQDTEERHGVKAVSWLSIPSILHSLRGADLLISGGGSLLQNVTSGRSLYYYLGIIFLAKMVGTPIMLYAQGIGPIYGRIARGLMSWLGNRVNLITVRDHGSLEELDSLKITKPHIECTADPVLAISAADLDTGTNILRAAGVVTDKATVGISVREWKDWQRYKEVIASVSDTIVRELKAQVVFLPMQYPDDVKAAEDIAAFATEKTVVLRSEYSTMELLSLVGNMDLMVSIRLHALIFAGVMGIPMVGLSYDPKIDRFLDSIGEKPVGTLEGITGKMLMAEIRRKWQRREEFRAQNAALFGELRKLAAKNAELALQLLG